MDLGTYTMQYDLYMVALCISIPQSIQNEVKRMPHTPIKINYESLKVFIHSQ